MAEYKTPDSLIAEMVELRRELSKGVAALHNAQLKMSETALEADKAYSLALINAEGTVADREAVARLMSIDQRKDADVAKAVYDRVKTKMRVLETNLSSLQSQGKLVEVMYRTAGLGEH